jgi:hypothetical protein
MTTLPSISMRDIIPFSDDELAANRRAAYSTTQLAHARDRIAARIPSPLELTVRFVLGTRLGRIIGAATLAMSWGVLSLWFIVVYYGEPLLIIGGFIAALVGIAFVVRTFYVPVQRFTDWQNARPALKCVEGVLRVDVHDNGDDPTPRWTLCIEGDESLRIPMGTYTAPIHEQGQALRFYVLDFGFVKAVAAFEPLH